MKNKFSKILLIFVLIFNLFFLGGCWDSRELDRLYIVVGTAIDLAENDEYELTMQIAKTQEASQNANQQAAPSAHTIILSAKNKSIVDAYMTANENCSRGLLFEHNQVLMFGENLAREGLLDVLDVFIRVQEARIEVPIIIVEGDNASATLKINIDEHNISSVFIYRIFEGLSIVSKLYKTRIIDLMNQLLSENHATTIPMIKIVQKEGKNVIEFSGFALIKDGKMIGKFTQEQVRGYVFAMGKVSSLIFHSENEDGLAGFRTQTTHGKINAKISAANQVTGNINVKGEVELDEFMGYFDVQKEDFANLLKDLASSKITQLIDDVIEICQNLQCDIFGFAEYLWKNNPKAWRQIYENWDEIFSQMQIKVNVDLEVPSFGDITQSIAIEKINQNKENNIDGN